MFNEMYNECFEDVELNLNLTLKGLENYLLGTHAAYHYESKSRNMDTIKNDMESDFNNVFIPFINKNIQKLKSKLFFTN